MLAMINTLWLISRQKLARNSILYMGLSVDRSAYAAVSNINHRMAYEL